MKDLYTVSMRYNREDKWVSATRGYAFANPIAAEIYRNHYAFNSSGYTYRIETHTLSDEIYEAVVNSPDLKVFDYAFAIGPGLNWEHGCENLREFMHPKYLPTPK